MKKEKINFFVKRQRLVGALFIPDAVSFPVPGVVFYHGRGSSQKGYLQRAEALTKQGIVCLTFDFRGCGKSEGDFNRLTNNDGLVDALAGFDFLISQKKVNENRVGVCGSSCGGYLTAIVSSKRRVKSIVLRAPASYKDTWSRLSGSQISDKFTGFMKSKGTEEHLAFKSIRKFKGSLLVIGSEKDEIIPQRLVRAYYNNAISTKKRKIVFIKNATHVLAKKRWNKRFIQLMVDWFLKTLYSQSVE